MKKAVVLAAGKGVRLQPFTNTRPKHLIPIAGAPLILHVLKAIKEAGIEKVLVVGYYMLEKIKSYLEELRSNLKLEFEYVNQGGIYGTAHALSIASNFVGEDDFLLIYGDIVFDYDIVKDVIRTHESAKPIVTMATMLSSKPQDFGVVYTHEDRVLKVEEKPKHVITPSYVNIGIYAMSPEVIDFSKQTPLSERGEYELTTTINMLIEHNKEVLAVKVREGSWLDVGRPWNILDANRFLLNKLVTKQVVEGAVENNVSLKGPVVIEEGARVRSGAYIEGPTWISEGCDIGPNCYIRPYTYLAKNVRIGNACEIKESVLMEGTHVGHLSYVGDSVIGEHCNLGAGTITANLRFDDAPVKVTVKGERISSGRRKLGAFLGGYVKTGINVSFLPGVIVGEYSWIGPHILVDRDIPPKTIVLLKHQELEFRCSEK